MIFTIDSIEMFGFPPGDDSWNVAEKISTILQKVGLKEVTIIFHRADVIINEKRASLIKIYLKRGETPLVKKAKIAMEEMRKSINAKIEMHRATTEE